eukprot:GFKZ01011215.1.p1 GENE.GFKZ01011215.1~~GFKZ01011215.1.p1  ORF type:complete len:328 (+),score=44.88 GFKZ01011215.1:65-1048(+)
MSMAESYAQIPPIWLLAEGRAQHHPRRTTSNFQKPLLPTFVPSPLHLLSRQPRRPSSLTRSSVCMSVSPPRPRPRPRASTRPHKSHTQDTDPEERYSPEKLGFIHIGTVTGAHGIKGEAKVITESQFASQRLKRPSSPTNQRYLLLPGRKYPRPVKLGPGRKASQKGMWILRVGDTKQRDEVLAFRGARLYVKDDDRPRMGGGEWMVGEVVGGKVKLIGKDDVIGVVVGVVTRHDLCRASGAGDRLAAVAADLIEVELFAEDEGKRRKEGETGKKVLVPFVKEIVPVVDVAAGVVVLDPPKGLLDIAVVNDIRKRRPPRGLLMPVKE